MSTLSRLEAELPSAKLLRNRRSDMTKPQANHLRLRPHLRSHSQSEISNRKARSVSKKLKYGQTRFQTSISKLCCTYLSDLDVNKLKTMGPSCALSSKAYVVYGFRSNH